MKVRVSKVELADCPGDGGKWVLYCDHLENGEWLNGGMVQGTNKKILASLRTSKFGDGLTTWCPACQDTHGTK